MVALTNLRLPATWTTAQPDNPAFDISANELDDDLEVIGDLDFGAFDLKATDIAATNFKANDATASFSIANATGILTMSANFNIAGNNIINTGTLTLPTSTDTLVGRATTDTLTNKSIDLTDNTLTGTSLELATAISDETGSGLLVFGTSPTIVTPTIASFTNAAHDHSNAAGGAQILSTAALSDTASIAYLDTANVYTAGTRQDFLGLLAGTSGMNVGGIAGNPTTQVNGDIWYNSTSNTLFARINAANVDLGQTGEVTTWTANHDAAGFNLLNLNELEIENIASDGFNYTITGSAIIADRIATLPLLLSGDTFVFENHIQTLVGKTLTTPTIVATGFTNMQHTHAGATTAGQLVSTTALSDTANIAYLNTANTYTARPQIFDPDGTNAGMNVGAQAGDPSALTNGDIWYNSTSNLFRGRENGITVSLAATGNPPFDDNVALLQDSADTTKKLLIDVDNVTTATTVTYDVMNRTGLIRSNRPAWTYFLEKDGANIVATKFDGTITSSGQADLSVTLSAINTDAGSSPMHIELAEGDYTVSTNFEFADKNNISIDGAGIDLTRILINTGVLLGSPIAFKGNVDTTFRNVTSPVAATTNSLTLQTGTDEDFFTAKDWIILKSDDIIGGTFKNGIFVRVKTVTIDDSGVLGLYGVVDDDQFITNVRCSTINFATGISLSNFTWLDQRTTAETGKGQLRIRWCKGITLNRIKFEDCTQFAVKFDRCREVTVNSCHLENMRQPAASDKNYGFQPYASEDVTINGCTGWKSRHFVTINMSADGSSTDKLEGRSRNVVVNGCTFRDTDAAALDVHEGARYCTFSNNTLLSGRSSTQDFGIGARAPITITNNVITGFATGINLFSEDATDDQDHKSTVVGNRIDVFATGILFRRDHEQCLIANNDIRTRGTSSSGINLERNTAPATHSGNKTIIVGNRIDGGTVSTNDGIRADGQIEVQITDNYITNYENSIELLDTDTTAKSWYIAGNYFVANTNNAPATLSGSDHLYANNREGGAAGEGITHSRLGSYAFAGVLSDVTATSGILRLPKRGTIGFRNEGNTNNHLISTNNADNFTFKINNVEEYEFSATELEMKTNGLLGIATVNLNDATILTISAGGAIASAQSYHTVAANSGTADDLDTINGGVAGDYLVLKADTGDNITVREVGNIKLTTATFSLDGTTLTDDRLVLLFDGTDWIELSRADH